MELVKLESSHKTINFLIKLLLNSNLILMTISVLIGILVIEIRKVVINEKKEF